jgi:uncharacterized Zn finger protein
MICCKECGTVIDDMLYGADVTCLKCLIARAEIERLTSVVLENLPTMK